MTSPHKVAVVTGAGTGIGKHSALALLEEGYAVVLAGRRKEPLEETAAEAKSAASRALVVPTDVGDPAAVRALFARTMEAFGRLDLLFNNAGIGAPPAPLEDLTYEQWKAVVDVNLTGAFLCTQEAFRIMKSQQPRGGRIINNGSIAVEPTMDVRHVARAVVYMASLPLDANVQFLTVMATKMPFVGRG